MGYMKIIDNTKDNRIKCVAYTKDHIIGDISDFYVSIKSIYRQQWPMGSPDFRTVQRGKKHVIYGTATFIWFDFGELLQEIHVNENLFYQACTEEKSDVIIDYRNGNINVFNPCNIDIELEDGRIRCIKNVFLYKRSCEYMEFPYEMAYVASEIEHV